jgi:hypothetical protein
MSVTVQEYVMVGSGPLAKMAAAPVTKASAASWTAEPMCECWKPRETG